MPLRLAGVVLTVCLLSVALKCVTVSPVSAATINVPPVTITQFDHRWWPDQTARDAVTIPGTDYTSSTFSAAVATGDVVVVRIQAPPGKKFVVHAPEGSTARRFSFYLFWSGGDAPSSSSQMDGHTTTFENLQGAAPRETYSYVALSNLHDVVHTSKRFTYSERFEFTAIAIEISATRPVASTMRSFTSVRSSASPSILFGGTSSAATAPLVEILDSVVPTLTTTWGRVKVLYR